MIEYVFKKPYTCELGTIAEGRSMRVASYNGSDYIYMDGGILETAYNNILMELITNPRLHREYLTDKEVIENKV